MPLGSSLWRFRAQHPGGLTEERKSGCEQNAPRCRPKRRLRPLRLFLRLRSPSLFPMRRANDHHFAHHLFRRLPGAVCSAHHAGPLDGHGLRHRPCHRVSLRQALTPASRFAQEPDRKARKSPRTHIVGAGGFSCSPRIGGWGASTARSAASQSPSLLSPPPQTQSERRPKEGTAGGAEPHPAGSSAQPAAAGAAAEPLPSIGTG